MSEKPTAIILPSWNPDEPRFIVEDAHDGLADDRAFKNGKCVYNQRLGIVYTVEYIVDALNELGDEIDKLKEENKQLRHELDILTGCYYMTERKVSIVLEDNFGRVMTRIKTELSPPKLMDKIMELFDDE